MCQTVVEPVYLKPLAPTLESVVEYNLLSFQGPEKAIPGDK